jgi:mannose-6-phosphate isomerase-like protein (cupin superfamily)
VSSVRFDAAEDEVASFRRERLAEGVHQASVRLRPGQTSGFHLHSTTRDVFYVLEGLLDVLVKSDRPGADGLYRELGVSSAQIRRSGTGWLHELRLGPGECVVVLPRTVHASANTSDRECAFLCLEGPGAYDFVHCDERGLPLPP